MRCNNSECCFVHNSNMKKSIIIKSLVVAIGLPLLAGCVEREVYRESPPPPAGEAVVEQPSEPPPSQVEVVPPQPDITFIWVPGAYEWRGRWVWVGGRWASPPHRGAVWIRGGWVLRDHHSVWVRGHWR